MGKRTKEILEDGGIEKREMKRRKKEAKRLHGVKRSSKERTDQIQDDGLTDPGGSCSLARRVPEWPVFHEKKLELSMALLPIDLRNTVKAVESSLRSMLFKFSHEMGGVLISFSDVVIQHGGHGRILNDLPHILFNVTCKVLVFRPVKKSTLLGQVKESFPSHLSLTVYHYFNASVTATSLRENGFSFDKTNGEWLKDNPTATGGTSIAVGSKLRFQVSSVHESGGIISIEGMNPST